MRRPLLRAWISRLPPTEISADPTPALARSYKRVPAVDEQSSTPRQHMDFLVRPLARVGALTPSLPLRARTARPASTTRGGAALATRVLRQRMSLDRGAAVAGN